MTSLNPQPPFVFPEPRVAEGMASYEQYPPYDALALASQSLFGIVSGVTESGIKAMQTWLESSPDLRVCLVVMVYPACATRQADFSRLMDLVAQMSNRLSVRVRPLDWVSDRASNTLCFLSPASDAVYFVTGPSEDFGMAPRQDGHANFVFRAEPALAEAFKRYFDWEWAGSRDISAQGVAQIPGLKLPEGTEDAARLWQAYLSACRDVPVSADSGHPVAQIDAETGDVTLRSEDGKELVAPTEQLGLEKLDQLAERIARLYAKGALVSIDKLSRVPPLDAPLDPSAFGDAAETHKGNVVRKVRMRVSIIDEKTLKDIEKRRQGLRGLLTTFTFGLADNMRWMPNAARALFESELKRLNEEGQKLISDLLKGDVNAFIEAKRENLAADINGMYATLGRPGQVTDDVIQGVVDGLRVRLDKAQSASFMPSLSYSHVGFARTETPTASPWGQAYALLADVAAFPRKALTDPFFLRGLKVSEEETIEAMNVADDAMCRDMRSRGIKERCKEELGLLSRIEKASITSRERCELVSRILGGDGVTSIDEAIKKLEST
jgi:hypothetical protein